MAKEVILIVLKIISNIIYLMVAITVSITLLPFVLGYKPVVVLSGSMEPQYPVGSIIYYKNTDFVHINVGDAITFKLGGGALATHRVIQKDSENQLFITKGDNNQSVDVQPVVAEAVVGKTGKIAIPYAGFVCSYIKALPIITAMGVILIICAISSPEKKKTGRGVCRE